MAPDIDFADWRTSLGLSQLQAASALGISRRIAQYYEAGEQAIPAKVRLAMNYLSEHPGKLREAKNAPLPLNDVQRGALTKLRDGQIHRFDRKIGKALVSRRFARELAAGFVITDAGRAALTE